MTPSDKKILKQALASLPSSRRASLESVLVEDADPSSENQNKPESYYGLEPKGIQARKNLNARPDFARMVKQAEIFGRTLAGQPPIAIALKDALKKLGQHEIGKALLKGYLEGQRMLDEDASDEYGEDVYFLPDIAY